MFSLLFNRLDNASIRMGRDRQNKLENWENKKDNIDKLIDQTERKLKIHEIVDDDLPTVRQQTEDLSVSKNLVPGLSRERETTKLSNLFGVLQKST